MGSHDKESDFFPSFSMKVKNGDNNNGEQTVDITVYEYFAKHRGIELTSSAYLPCLDVGKPKRPNYLPLEVCRILCLTELCSGSYFIPVILFCCNSLAFWTNYIWFFSSLFHPFGGVAMFICFPPAVYKSIISKAKSIFSWEFTPEASRENQNSDKCMFIVIDVLFPFLLIMC